MNSNRDTRLFGPLSAALVVVASMVGTGVFTTTGFLVRDIGSNTAILIAWIVGGVTATCGALAYAELVAMFPNNGGEYQLLSRIYHPALGVASAWVSLIVGFSAPIAAAAMAFGEYFHDIWPAAPPRISALALIILSSLLHSTRVALGRNTLNIFTVLNVVLIVAFIGLGLEYADIGHLTEPPQREVLPALISSEFAVGLIYIAFAYSGWNSAAYIAGEVKNPARSLPIALIGGSLLVTALYFGLNLVFLSSAPSAQLAGQVDVAHIATKALLGQGWARALAALVALGLITTVVALVLTGPRVYEQLGRDYPRLKLFAGRRGHGGPQMAIAIQTGVALLMTLTASFDALLTYMGLTLSLFAGLTIAGVFILRYRTPEVARPYRAWGYPTTVAVALALMLWMIVHSIVQRPVPSLVGLATAAAGFLLYIPLRRQ